VILLESLDNIVKWESLGPHNFHGVNYKRLSSPGNLDYTETWFLAAKPNSYIIQRWFFQLYKISLANKGRTNDLSLKHPRSFERFMKVSASRLVETFGDPPVKKKFWSEYLVAYVVFMELYHSDSTFRNGVLESHLEEASRFGYFLHDHFNWDIHKVMSFLVASPVIHNSVLLQFSKTKLLKLSASHALHLGFSALKPTSHCLLQQLVPSSKSIYVGNRVFHRNQFVVVISTFNEDISWSSMYKGLRVIVNKGPSNRVFDVSPSEAWSTTPNVGREAETFLTYIVQNYFVLPDFVAFTQGGLDLAHSWVREKNFGPSMFLNMLDEAISNGNTCSNGLPVHDHETNNMWGFKFSAHTIWDKKYNSTSQLAEGNFGDFFWNDAQLKLAKNALFVYPSAYMVIHKSKIRSRNVQFYKRLLNFLQYSNNPLEGHYFERSWFHIFQCDLS
jgi:hypothetical protein